MSGSCDSVPDLRRWGEHELCDVAGQALDVVLYADQTVCKRRSFGAPTARGTWVRLSVSAAARAVECGGIEATASFPNEVACPRWLRSHTWREQELLWRVEETEQVTESVIQSGGVLPELPMLSTKWWQRLQTSVRALATVDGARIATPHTRPINQQRIADMITAVAPGTDTTVSEWSVSHADLSWVNLTAPRLWILDWEDFGVAPRGWDAATLWAASLAVPTLAQQVQHVFAADLDTRSGMVCQLYQCAELIRAGVDYAGPLLSPAHAARKRLVTELG